MKTLLTFLFDPMFLAGPVGLGLVIMALLDAWVSFRWAAQQRGSAYVRLAVRLLLLLGASWLVMYPVIAMFASQAGGTQQVGVWSSFGYLMGFVGRADDILRIQVDLVLSAFIIWLSATGLMQILSAIHLWGQEFGQCKKKVSMRLQLCMEVMSTILIGVATCGIRLAIGLLHPGD